MTKQISKKSQRLFALLLAVAMLFSVMPMNAIAVIGTNVNEDGFIEVRTIGDLYNVRDDLTANYILMNDIDLTIATAQGGDWDYGGRGWNPIGSNDIYGDGEFSGVFDGNGYAIIGMRIDYSESTAPSGIDELTYTGLFAKVTGEVRNLEMRDVNIADAYASNQIYVGAVAAYNKGIIINCSVSGGVHSNINTSAYCQVGGIAGCNNGTISKCFNAARASANKRNAGGIAGENSYDGNITNCYNAGDISVGNSEVSSAGGITSLNRGTITNCYNIGTVSNSYKKDYAYAIAYLNGSTSKIVNSYYLSGTGAGSTGATSLTSAQMLIQSLYTGFDFDGVWVQDPNANYPYPQLQSNLQDMRVIESIVIASEPNKKEYKYGDKLNLTGASLEIKYNNSTSEFIDITEDMVSGYSATNPGIQNISVTYKGITNFFTVKVNEKIFVPVYTIADLYNIRNDLTANYILMNDIDLTEATAPGGAYDFMGNGWNPIGSSDIYGAEAFTGDFDGNGHKIIGMQINLKSLPSGTTTVHLGLFSNIEGSVHDLTIDGGIINAPWIPASTYTHYVGSVAGKSSGRIYNITNNMESISCSSSWEAANYTGGIIGKNSGIIENCSNTTQVTASVLSHLKPSSDGTQGRVGGIAGDTSGEIRNCYNTGDISISGSDNYESKCTVNRVFAGGISGVSSATIIHCYNTGNMSATFDDVKNVSGGICGEGSIIKMCYNIGTARYGIAKESSNETCYYLSGAGASNTGATSLTEPQMRTQSMYPGFDFENTWILNEYANHPYPQLRSNVQDLEESAALVSIISWPLKQEYYTGDALVLDGCMIDVTYVSGRKELLSVTADMISGYDNTTDGEQTVTVTYRGSSDTFPVTVKARPVVTGVELISLPTTTEFRVGTAFDFTGAKIRVSYEGGATEELDVTEDMVTGANIHHLGKQTLTVTYYGQSDTFEVTVTSVSIASLRLDAAPDKVEYLEKEALDLTGMVLTAVMNNGTENEIASGYLVSGYSSVPGTHMVTVSYMGKSVSFMVTVKAKTVVDLKLQAVPTKREYVAGEAFNAAGMMVVATYDNGDVEVVEDYELIGFDAVPGLKTVVVSFGDKYVAFTVSVIARVITDFAITSYPAKLEYLQYDAFDSTGLEVKATYNDGMTEVVTGYELVGYSSNPGTHTVSVAYEGWVETFEVTVNPRELTNLVVVAPTKLTYYLSEAFDPSGLTVTACYNNGQQVIVEDYSMTGFDSNTPGTKTITIGYGGLTSEFSVSVSERSEIVTEGSFTVGNLVGRLGDTVVIPVSVNKNTGIAGFTHTITFDATNLKFVSAAATGIYANGTIVVNQEKAAMGEITVLWFGAANVVNNGDVYNLTFEVLETATDGISDITISFDENDNGNISGENVLFGTVDGYVDIRSYWLGDLDGDRKYAMVDLLQLAQYVSGKEMTLTDKQKLSADVNEDGNIDIHDVIMLNQWLLVADM